MKSFSVVVVVGIAMQVEGETAERVKQSINDANPLSFLRSLPDDVYVNVDSIEANE